MTDGLKMIDTRVGAIERGWLELDFWKTRMVPYLKGSRLWPYVSEPYQDTATLKPRS